MTPYPAEMWDDDDDFDLSGLSHHALGLPRSEKSSEDARHVHESGLGRDERVQVRRVSDDDNGHNGEKRSWDADFDDISDHDNKNREDDEDNEDDDDDDKVNTLKLSDLTSATLAQLSSLRKSSKLSPENQDLASLSVENLSGKVTNLGSFSHRSHITHADVCDWDEGLELPDAFPVLRSTRRSNDEMALSDEANLEAPSLGSLSDVTTVDSATSDSRDQSLTHSSAASKDDRVSRSSTSSHSSAVGFRPVEPAVKIHGEDSEDSSFELSGSISKLQLNPRLLCKAPEVLPNQVVEVSRIVRAADLCSSAEVENVNAIRSPRYLNTTAASRARQTNNPDHRRATTSAPLVNWPSRIMREPRRVRNYGNGMELDSFADLPIYQTYTPHREAESVDWRYRKEGAQTIVRLASGSTSSPADNASRGKARKTRRKEPTLIRNLGGPSTVPRIVGDMRWNPAVQRWEGNEEEGRSFEMAVTGRGKGGAARGAKLSASSAKVILGPTRKAPARQHVGEEPSPMHSMDTRLVGDMVFDPIRLCWLNKNKEDEVDPFADMNEELEEPDSFRTGSPTDWNGSSSIARPRSELGRTREPQWSAAAISRALRGRNKDSVPDALANRIPTYLWLECIAAKRRHDEQIAGFIPTIPQQRSAFHRATRGPKNDRSRHLHLIQMLARRGGLD